MKKYLSKFTDEEIYTLLAKFIPTKDKNCSSCINSNICKYKDAPLKDKCCQKYITRDCNRYCYNCPLHKFYFIDSSKKESLYLLLNNEKYIDFINYLKELNLPYPDEKYLELFHVPFLHLYNHIFYL